MTEPGYIHIEMSALAPSQAMPLGQEAQLVLDVLRDLHELPYFVGGFAGTQPPPTDTSAYIAAVEQGMNALNQGRGLHPFLDRANDPACFHLFFRTARKLGSLDEIALEFRFENSAAPVTSHLIYDIINIWQRHMQLAHVRVAPGLYVTKYSGVGRGRLGIGWCGWVPFHVSVADIAAAEQVRSLGEGTFLASQKTPFVAHGSAPDIEAIARAQAMEVQVNRLGYLPVRKDVRSGAWGKTQ